MRKKYLLLATLLVVGCVPKKVNEEPILTNDDRVPDSSATVADASDRAAENQREARERQQDLQAEALATCEPRVCEAVVRGELAIGMNESQVLVVTGTTEEAWSIRWSGESAVMSPLTMADAPHDVMGDVAMVQIAPAGVSRYAYREPSGIRLVASVDDASNEGRARAMAAQLVREGDDQAAAGDFVAALDRYDRASLLNPGDPMIDYKIAVALDKQLRPIEALLQYQLFLHRLELEIIEAEGEAAARLAEAIALAQQRIIILERSAR